jgi:hypothetical protein
MFPSAEWCESRRRLIARWAVAGLVALCAAMLDTVAEWFQAGRHNAHGVTLDRKTELDIWRRHNPGIFEGAS